jgi:hypothetical protein
MRRTNLLLLLLSACSVGTYGETMQMTGDGNSGGGDDKNLCVDKAAAAPAYNHTGNDGQPAGPRAGMGCVAAACHLAAQPGAGAPPYGFGGTIYKDIAGTIPQGGVTVRFFPTTGNTKKSVATVVTDDAGNFYIADGTLTAFPYNVDATGCGLDGTGTNNTGIRPMVALINKVEGNCNAGGTCHQVVPTKTATPAYLLD